MTSDTPRAPEIVWGFISPETGDFIGVTEDGMRRRWGAEARADFAARLAEKVTWLPVPEYDTGETTFVDGGVVRRAAVLGLIESEAGKP